MHTILAIVWTLRLPFACRGAAGEIAVTVRVNADPEREGLPLVARGYDRERFAGFPVATATLHYDGIGYRGIFGWLQGHRSARFIRRHVMERGRLNRRRLRGDSPLCSFGWLPSFYDAPANPDHPDGLWLADAFLVAIPDFARSRTLTCVTGFRWGYELRQSRPVVLPPEPAPDGTWADHLATLRGSYPDWDFVP